MQSVAVLRTRFGRTQRRAFGFKAKSRPGPNGGTKAHGDSGAHHAGRAAKKSDDGARGVSGDRMHGSLRCVNQGGLSVIRSALSPEDRTKCRAGRSQSVHTS